MKTNFDKSFALVIASEGGYTDDPRDPGNKLADGRKGCTIWGCTQATWEAYWPDIARSLSVILIKPWLYLRVKK